MLRDGFPTSNWVVLLDYDAPDHITAMDGYAVLFKLLLTSTHSLAPPRKGFILMVTPENISEDIVWLAF